MKLPRRHSINDRSDFQNVRKRGNSVPGRFFVLGTLAEPSLPALKVGLITTKKIGNAVTRNRVRRYFRAVLQRHGEKLDGPRYLVFVARWRAGEATFDEIEKDFFKCARKLGILKAEASDAEAS